MDAHEWHSRWQEGRIGFHEGKTNRHLERFWDLLDLPLQSNVLVPLCGKTVDMVSLHRRGHRVTGAELSEIACRAFFDEQGMVFDVKNSGDHDLYRGVDAAEGLNVWRGDFMTAPLEAAHDALFDRAALIALPPALRAAYVKRIASLMKPGARGLVVVIDYPAHEKNGPPFCVPQSEVEQRFGPDFEVAKLADEDALEREGAAQRWGLSALRELVFRVQRR